MVRASQWVEARVEVLLWETFVPIIGTSPVENSWNRDPSAWKVYPLHNLCVGCIFLPCNYCDLFEA